jgi:hypothetical protein
MVNFENDQTVATAPKQVVNMIVIENYYNLMSALEKFEETKLQGSPGNLARLRSRLINLIMSQFSAFKRHFEKDTVTCDNIKEIVDTNNKKSEEEIKEVIFLAVEWLDEKQLIRLDDRIKRDFTDIWEDNEVNGFT